jgi:hypothetical protein
MSFDRKEGSGIFTEPEYTTCPKCRRYVRLYRAHGAAYTPIPIHRDWDDKICTGR